MVCIVIDFNVSISAEVPSHVDYGGKAELYCFHNLPENHLLFLKWYKDEEEFCRLSPQGNSLIFSVTGIYLKVYLNCSIVFEVTILTYISPNNYSNNDKSQNNYLRSLFLKFKKFLSLSVVFN